MALKCCALVASVAFSLVAASLNGQQPILGTAESPYEAVLSKFKNASIIPEVIDAFQPEYILHAKWDNSTTVQLGNSIPPAALQHLPDVKLRLANGSIPYPKLPCRKHENFVLAITDPDARSRHDPDWSEVCHGVFYDYVPPSSSEPELQVMMPFMPPSPPPHTGAHRYVMLVFAPTNGTAEKLHLSKPADRKHWGYDGIRVGARRWAKEHGLKPVAGNFFYSQNPEQ